jgi:hypothetical protein
LKNIVQLGGGSEENKGYLSSDKLAGSKGWHSREIKPKEFKDEEGHIARGLAGHLVLG